MLMLEYSNVLIHNVFSYWLALLYYRKAELQIQWGKTIWGYAVVWNV